MHGEAVATAPGLRVIVRWHREDLGGGGRYGQLGCNRCGGEEGVHGDSAPCNTPCY
jgi:hypothetical protein